ncbi:hypothetical protein [Bradyrhizobium sp. AUGA SZCCT0431]|uniref:hypothetical protein n=1 Tax=Bradyrhizobium sp. AUGA SZCCT0431 TaxID=2807674 RepID=UPI001BA96CAC|nr:hypothetical protein [Bradyrhizobium sp. AUGA SZCCT0431]MBR1146669.1 hypothetical protein [Bradyrhizobium sp. AUGA SZCCT0431]
MRLITALLLAFLLPSTASAVVLGSSYAGSDTAFNFNLNVPKNHATVQWIIATPFTCASACTPDTAYFRLKKAAGSPTDGLNVLIYDQSASLPNAVVCTGANIDPAPLTTSFSTTSSAIASCNLAAGTYWLTLNRSLTTTDNANYVGPAGTNTSVNACGKGNPAGSWAVGCSDHGTSNIYFQLDGTLGGGAAAAEPFRNFVAFWW